MPVDYAGSADHAVTTNFQAARHNDATGNCRIVANHDVMCNLALVINDHTIANNSVIQRATINSSAGTDLHAIANNYATNLWDLHPVTTIVGITKAVCAYHCSGLDQAILTDLDLMVNGYVRPETRTCTDFAVFTYEATGTDNHVIAQFNAGLNHRVSANRYVVTQLRRRVNHRTGCNVLRGLRRGI